MGEIHQEPRNTGLKSKAIDWFKAPTQVLDDSNPPFYKWFADGELNVSYNTLDRQIKGGRKTKSPTYGKERWVK